MVKRFKEQGSRLKIVRKELNFTQMEFVNILHWGQSSLSDCERGFRSIPSRIENKLIEMGYNLTWLRTGKGDKKILEIITDFDKPEANSEEKNNIINNISKYLVKLSSKKLYETLGFVQAKYSENEIEKKT